MHFSMVFRVSLLLASELQRNGRDTRTIFSIAKCVHLRELEEKDTHFLVYHSMEAKQIFIMTTERLKLIRALYLVDRRMC